MNRQEIFTAISNEVKSLLESDASPDEVIEVLAAVSVHVGLQVAPSPEYAYLSVFEGLTRMTALKIKHDGEAESEKSVEVSDGDEIVIEAGTTLH